MAIGERVERERERAMGGGGGGMWDGVDSKTSQLQHHQACGDLLGQRYQEQKCELQTLFSRLSKIILARIVELASTTIII